MGLLSRFSDIMNANLQDLLSKAEGANADKLLEKYINDARENLGALKAETAAIMADEVQAERDLRENEELYRKYARYAEEAVKAGNDDDARKFLAHNQTLENQKVELRQKYDLAKSNTEKMKQMTTKLVSDIETAQGKLNELKQKLNVAKQQENLNKLNSKISKDPLGNYDNLMGSVQKRIDTAEAASRLNDMMGDTEKNSVEELAKKYGSPGTNDATDSVEDQLSQLKAKLQQPQQ